MDSLGKPVESENPKTMEELGQNYGYVLYRTSVKGRASGKLTIKGLADYGQVFLDGQPVATLDRRLKQESAEVSIPADAAGVLDVLVESDGRINYGHQLVDNHKGITGAVTLGDAALAGWKSFRCRCRRWTV